MGFARIMDYIYMALNHQILCPYRGALSFPDRKRQEDDSRMSMFIMHSTINNISVRKIEEFRKVIGESILLPLRNTARNAVAPRLTGVDAVCRKI